MTLYDAPHRKITADEFHAMGEAGILAEQERVELIDGHLVVMEPIGWPHASIVMRLNRLLVERTPYGVSPQNPLRLSDHTEPQPDIALLSDDCPPEGPFLGPHSLLVVEVSDSSLAYDRDVKLPRYALASVPLVWIVDVNGRCVHEYAQPLDDKYTSYSMPERLALPGGSYVDVSEIFLT